MTDTLLAKATALLEPKKKTSFHGEPLEWGDRTEDNDDGYGYIPQGSYLGDTLITLADTYENSAEDCDYIALAANTAAEIITGFQQLLKEKDGIIQTLEDEN